MSLLPSNREPAFDLTVSPTPIRSKWRRRGRLALGWLLLFGGILGLVLPVLQGWAMIFAGMAILRHDIPWVARVWDRWVAPLHARYQHWREARRQRRLG